jgi:hypothetical protein
MLLAKDVAPIETDFINVLEHTPGTKAESISCNCRWVNRQHDPTIGRSFATFGGNLRSSDHFCGVEV